MTRRTFAKLLTRIGLVAALSAGAAHADETTFCNTHITTLPYVVNTQGHYCFDRNLSTAITTGNAITINSDFVLLDLNNFKLGGGSAGTASDAVGVYANNRSNLTIRGGNIRGFGFGIVIQGTTDTSAQNIVVENNVLDGNLKAGIIVVARGGLVRNNLVSNTGGTTSAVPYCVSFTNLVVGISQRSIDCAVGAHSTDVIGNTVSNTVGSNNAVGIYMSSSTSAAVVDNIVRHVTGLVGDVGIQRDSGSVVCKGNLVQEAAPPYGACTLVGTTNYP